MEENRKIRLPITEDTMMGVAILCSANILFFAAHIPGVSNFIIGLSGGWVTFFGFVALIILTALTALIVTKANDIFNYYIKPEKPIIKRKPLRVTEDFIEIILGVIGAIGMAVMALIVKYNFPLVFAFLVRHYVFSFVAGTVVFGLLAYVYNSIMKWIPEHYRYVGWNPGKGLKPAATRLDEMGIQSQETEQSFLWDEIVKVTAEMIERGQDDRIVILSIYGSNGQVLTTDNERVDFDEVLENIGFMFQLPDARDVEYYLYEEDYPCCTLIWQKG